MNILIAPDSFKGSLSALAFCQIAEQTIQSLCPDACIEALPMADGGEGTMEAFLAQTRGEKYAVQVHDPLGKLIIAQYAMIDTLHFRNAYFSNTSFSDASGKNNTIAIIEMACASGLPLIDKALQDPMKTSSFGTGELIKDALTQGCRQFIIGLGGSATNDGGMGMLQALGVIFYDKNQQPLQACGAALEAITDIDLSHIDSRCKQSEFIIAADVNNPLLGENGATFVYGKQKGADPKNLLILEQGMHNFVQQTQDLMSKQGLKNAELIHLNKGAGAAGGLGFALMAYCQANMYSGFELIAQLAQLDTLLAGEHSRPDLIISGEGCFDRQSLQGKLIGRLVQRTQHYKIPLVVICGCYRFESDLSTISSDLEVVSLCSLASCNDANHLEHCIKKTSVLIKEAIGQLMDDKCFFEGYNP